MMNQLGLRSKMLAGYGVVLLLIVLVLVWAIHNLLRLGQASEAILSENYRSILAAENMIDALERQDSGVLLYILGFEQEGISQFQENERKFLQWFSRAHDNITIDGEENVVARIDSTYSAYRRAFSQFMLTTAATGRRQAQHYHDALLPAFMSVRDASTDLRELNQRTMYSASESAEGISHAAIISMTSVGLLAIVMALVFSVILSSRIVRPVEEIQSAVAKLAEGDYEVEVPTDASGELGRLADQFNIMTARLRAYRDLNIEQIVAEKRKSEAIIRSIDDGIIAVDADLNIIDVNPTAAHVLDVDPTEVTTRSIETVIGHGALLSSVQTTLETGQPPAIDENDAFLTLTRNGRDTHFQYAVTPVRTRGGAMLGAIVLFRDVTQLKELDRLKSQFVAMASHELQTPLTSISMSLGLLQERIVDRLDERERDLLDVAGEDTERLRSLVRDLLDLSKIEAGRIEMQLSPVPVHVLLEAAREALRSQADERSITLCSERTDDLPNVRADADKITWVLTNLISNALRYTDEGGHIRLAAHSAGTKVHISVIDDGAGIAYQYQAKVFEKFVQVSSGGNAGGSGLGLAICKEIVRAHGGSIWVDSTPGLGSTFTFTLPIA